MRPASLRPAGQPDRVSPATAGARTRGHADPAAPVDAAPQAGPGLCVRNVRALARSAAATVQEARRLTPELAEALTEAGFARHFVPRRFGGSAGRFASVLAATAEVAEECASTAWCGALFAAHGRLAAYLPEEGQAELWAQGPDVRIAAAVNPPSGTTHAVAGGWRLAGRWGLASGVDHAQWILLAAWTPDAAGRPEHRVLAVPRTDFETEDTWRSTGLRGTGSNAVTVREAWVPAHRTMTLGELGRQDPGAARCHAVPYPMVSGLQFAAPGLGAARGALTEWRRAMTGRKRANGRAARETAAAQDALSRSSAEVRAAGLLLAEAARRADEAGTGALDVAENVRDTAHAAELCATAAGRLTRASGARALAENDPVQLRWRDTMAVACHAALNVEEAAAAYARAVLGDGPGSGESA
ncbi:oxidoreductase [Streptomyces sp. NPDC048109]|uniref:oxidoreductase n=1 Tax=unclassified Streptomyces TaxID=2593676 RepID=UPI0033F7D83E